MLVQTAAGIFISIVALFATYLYFQYRRLLKIFELSIGWFGWLSLFYVEHRLFSIQTLQVSFLENLISRKGPIKIIKLVIYDLTVNIGEFRLESQQSRRNNENVPLSPTSTRSAESSFQLLTLALNTVKKYVWHLIKIEIVNLILVDGDFECQVSQLMVGLIEPSSVILQSTISVQEVVASLNNSELFGCNFVNFQFSLKNYNDYELDILIEQPTIQLPQLISYGKNVKSRSDQDTKQQLNIPQWIKKLYFAVSMKASNVKLVFQDDVELQMELSTSLCIERKWAGCKFMIHDVQAKKNGLEFGSHTSSELKLNVPLDDAIGDETAKLDIKVGASQCSNLDAFFLTFGETTSLSIDDNQREGFPVIQVSQGIKLKCNVNISEQQFGFQTEFCQYPLRLRFVGVRLSSEFVYDGEDISVQGMLDVLPLSVGFQDQPLISVGRCTFESFLSQDDDGPKIKVEVDVQDFRASLIRDCGFDDKLINSLALYLGSKSVNGINTKKRFPNVISRSFNLEIACYNSSVQMEGKTFQTVVDIQVPVMLFKQIHNSLAGSSNVDVRVEVIESYLVKSSMKERMLSIRKFNLVSQNADSDALHSFSVQNVVGNYGLLEHIIVYDIYHLLEPLFSAQRSNVSSVSPSKETTKSSPNFEVLVDKVDLTLWLPKDVKLFLVIDSFKFSFDGKQFSGQGNTNSVNTLTSDRVDLFKLQSLCANTSQTEDLRHLVEVSCDSAFWFLPFQYDFASFVDGCANMSKSIKQLHQYQSISCDYEPLLPEAAEFRKRQFQFIPTVVFQCNLVQLIFEDDCFDANLLRIFKLGGHECVLRQSRESALDSILKKSDFQNATDFDKLQKLRHEMRSLDSQLWIERVHRDKATSNVKSIQGNLKNSPLFHVVLINASIQIDPPILLAETVEQTLHELDPDTPADIDYDLALAAQIKLQFEHASVGLRDFPWKLVQIDRAASICGLVVIAESVRDASQSNRRINIPVLFRDGQLLGDVSIIRTIAPTKFYFSLELNLPDNDCSVTYGVGLEPHLADMNKVFAGLTPTSVDPSPPLPFWDKICLLFHGNIRIRAEQLTKLEVNLLGQRNIHTIDEFGRVPGLKIRAENGIDAVIGYDRSENQIDQDNRRPPIQIRLGRASVGILSAQDYVEHTFAAFESGVELGLEIVFNTEQGSNHSQIIMRPPERVADLETYDSFWMIRSKYLSMNYSLQAPLLASAAAGGQNSIFVDLNQDVINSLTAFSRLFTSILSVLPIKKGSLYQRDGMVVPKSQKLSRYIQDINIASSLKNILGTYKNRSESVSVGVSGRIGGINSTFSLQQQNFTPGNRGAGWDLISADFDLNSFTACALSQMYLDQSIAPQTIVFVDEVLQDNSDWLNIDASDAQQSSIIRLYSLLEAPRVIYFRQGQEKQYEFAYALDFQAPDKDVHQIQANLLTQRIEQLKQMIEQDKLNLKQWEQRMTLYFDDNLKARSQALVDKIANSYEKLKVVQDALEQQTKKMFSITALKSSSQVRLPSSQMKGVKGHRKLLQSLSIARQRRSSVNSMNSNASAAVEDNFKHHFIIHSLKVNWNLTLRDIMFKFGDLEAQQTAMRYYCSSFALADINERISSFAHAMLLSSQNTSQSSLDYAEQDDNVPLDHKVRDDVATKLLSLLVQESNTKLVVAEKEPSPESKQTNVDPNDPLYISPIFKKKSDMIIQCFYPQFRFKTSDSHTDDGFVIVTAEYADMKGFQILDKTVAHQDESVKLVKYRRIVGIGKAQFFSAFHQELSDLILRRGDQFDANKVWLPIESMIDLQVESQGITRFVSGSRFSVQIDSCNPLYIRKNFDRDVSANRLESSENPFELEHANTVFVNLPKIELFASSKQYLCTYDIVTNVLIYNDPERKDRIEQIYSLTLALTKEDLSDATHMLADIQYQLQTVQEALNWENYSWAPDISDEMLNYLLTQRSMLHQKLMIYMEAIRRVAFQRKVKTGIKKSSRLLVKSDDFQWVAKRDSGQNLFKIAFENFQYMSTGYEDQSHINTGEVDRLSVDNLLPNQFYANTLSFYNPQNRKLDFSRHKMLRVYWRELPAVAGIAVVDHFEVNIFPLQLSMTYEIGRALVEYFYPKKQKSVDSAEQSTIGNIPQSTSSSNLSATLATIQDQTTPLAGNAKPVPASILKSPFGSPRVGRTPQRSRSNTMKSQPSIQQQQQQQQSGSGVLLQVQAQLNNKFSDNALMELESVLSDQIEEETPDKKSTEKFRKRLLKKLIPLSVSKNAHVLTIDKDIKAMKDRASVIKSFVYIKVPSSVHCISYHGEKEKNIEDLDKFVLKLPTLEYHNRTWTWLEFMMTVRKDVILTVVSHTGSLVREKLTIKRKSEKKEVSGQSTSHQS
ncbi:hypothetical protein MP228_003402 [Amoeboaphelidium protococcarum]|nr:hypothetical protein MP228_003402 [Amoeboaphelidium protococcarum]